MQNSMGQGENACMFLCAAMQKPVVFAIDMGKMKSGPIQGFEVVSVSKLGFDF